MPIPINIICWFDSYKIYQNFFFIELVSYSSNEKKKVSYFYYKH